MSAHAIFEDFTPRLRTRQRGTWRSEPKQWSVLQSFEDSAPWVYRVFEQISALKSNGHSDPGSNGHALQDGAIRAAIRLLLAAPTTLLPEPSATMIPGGGIGFHWRTGSRDLEVECGPAGILEYLKTTLGDSEHEYEEGQLTHPDDDEFWTWLTEG